MPAYRDTHVRSAIGQAVRVEEAVLAQECVDGGEGVLRLRLTLAPGLSQDEVRALATRVGERLAADGETRARIEALAFEFVAA